MSDLKSYKDGFIGQRMTYVPGIVKRKVLNDERVKDLYITHIGVFPNAIGHLRKREFGCSQFILLYCVEGEGWIKLDGRTHILKANQLFVISPKQSCSYGTSDKYPWTNYWIHYTGENSELYSPELNKLINIPPDKDSRIKERLVLFEEMLQNIEDHFNTDRVIYANICLKHFLSSIKYLPVYRAIDKEPENDVIDKLIAYMSNNVEKNISMDEFAAKCGFSTSTLFKLFKRKMNSSPMDFFIHLKMQYACKSLIVSSMKVKSIAARFGYDDPYYFSRIFKKHIGLSPSDYRKEEIN